MPLLVFTSVTSCACSKPGALFLLVYVVIFISLCMVGYTVDNNTLYFQLDLNQ